MTWLVEFLSGLWAAARGAAAKQAAADVPRGEAIDKQIEQDAREIEERSRGR